MAAKGGADGGTHVWVDAPERTGGDLESFPKEAGPVWPDADNIS